MHQLTSNWLCGSQSPISTLAGSLHSKVRAKQGTVCGNISLKANQAVRKMTGRRGVWPTAFVGTDDSATPWCDACLLCMLAHTPKLEAVVQRPDAHRIVEHGVKLATHVRQAWQGLKGVGWVGGWVGGWGRQQAAGSKAAHSGMPTSCLATRSPRHINPSPGAWPPACCPPPPPPPHMRYPETAEAAPLGCPPHLTPRTRWSSSNL